MAGSINKVTLMGHLGRDPEVRKFNNGGQVVNLRIATSETWKDRQTGERRERTEWHTVSIFAERTGEIAAQYLRKGSRVYIEGQLETRKWQDKDNNDRYSTEVVVRPYSGRMMLMDRRSDTPGASDRQDRQYSSAPPSSPPDRNAQRSFDGPDYNTPSGGGYAPYPGASYGGKNSYDDDIPF